MRNLHLRRCFLFCPLLFDGLWVIFYVDVDPHQARNPEDIDKVDCQKYAQQAKGDFLSQVQEPVEKRNKKQAKPAGPYIGNEHGAVIVTWLGEVVQVAFGATLEHIERFFERPAPGLEHLAFVTARTLEVKNTVAL